jgi:hypothetical protein
MHEEAQIQAFDIDEMRSFDALSTGNGCFNRIGKIQIGTSSSRQR